MERCFKKKEKQRNLKPFNLTRNTKTSQKKLQDMDLEGCSVI